MSRTAGRKVRKPFPIQYGGVTPRVQEDASLEVLKFSDSRLPSLTFRHTHDLFPIPAFDALRVAQ